MGGETIMSKEKTNLLKRLGNIQTKLSVPRNQLNTFGGYKYRSCEDILEALKPLLLETNTIITINDEIVQVGERFYIKATVSLVDCDGDGTLTASAFAREPLIKKGMDESQITGTASSYARKYALNALFAIDDTKDADTDAHAKQVKNAPVAPVAPAPKITLMQKMSGSIMDAKDQPALDEIIAWLGENAKSFTGKQLEELQNLIDEKREGFTR